MINLKNALSEKELYEHKDKLGIFLELIEKRKQGFYKILDEDISKIEEFAKKSNYKNIIVCGIGGSALGTLCLQQALTHSHKKNLYVLDNIDPIMIKELEDVIDYSKTLVIVITKSGGTIETLSQYNYFKEKTKNIVVITGESSDLPKDFEIPENVGGRFSVLTAVGLLPAALMGLDIRALLKGAKEMRNKFLSTTFEENLPFQLATAQFHQYQKGRRSHVLMPYSQKLNKLADWWSQLTAESTGKDGKGITPLSAKGITDQHSQLQLYADGPDDKLIMFLEVKNLEPEIKIEKPYKTTFGDLMQIERTATASALTKSGRPNLAIQIESVTEETIGQLFLLFEGATAFLGEFLQINAFDQPGVELSKKLTKEALTK